MIKKVIPLIIILSLLGSLAACGAPPAPPTADDADAAEEAAAAEEETAIPELPSEGELVLISEVERVTNPDADEEAIRQLVNGNSQFAFDLYAKLIQDRALQGANLFFSPYSISSALAMTYGGAEQQTEMQMAETLHFNLGPEATHPAFNALNLYLDSLNEQAQEGEEGRFQLHIANAIWGQQGDVFREDYLDLLAAHYGAGMRTLDFVSAPEASRQTINQWVSDQTEEKIPELIPQGAITPDIAMVLTNAIYFLSSWAAQFDESQTENAPFTLADQRTTVQVPMMYQQNLFGYLDLGEYLLIELPYQGHTTAMYVVLPKNDTLAEVEGILNAARFEEAVSKIEYRQLKLYMPRFNTESDFSLKQILPMMGMSDAFDAGRADFSGINGARNLFISDVIHKAVIDVNEEGTEAAAATAVMISKSSAMIDEPIEVRLDHPFLYLIADRENGTILFMGRLMNPAE